MCYTSSSLLKFSTLILNMSQGNKRSEQEQYTKIITDEDNKKWFASLTEQEQTDLKLNTYRNFRNQKLQKTDAFMGQIDRYSQKQIDQLKAYRQDLRDMINKEPIVFPEEPEFIQQQQAKVVLPQF